MKLLFDHNLSAKLVNSLKDIFPNSNHVYNLNLDKVPDREIWNYAKENEFTIITKDSDFEDLSSFLGFPPKLILLKIGNCSTKEIINILINNQKIIFKFNDNSHKGYLILY